MYSSTAAKNTKNIFAEQQRI